jgi:hypothetical protein
MRRRFIATLAVVPLFATVGLFSSASPASAVGLRPVAGTYQMTVAGDGAQTLVLLHDHTVGTPFDNGSWVEGRRTVTIDVTGGQAPITLCLDAGQGPTCYVTDQFSGTWTTTGIGSPTDPGVANAYVGSELIDSEPFWAVRTGKP